MNPILVVVMCALVGLGVVAWASIESRDRDRQKREYAACMQRNEGRAAVRHIIERQKIGYAKIHDLANENLTRRQIRSDLAKVQPIDCGQKP